MNDPIEWDFGVPASQVDLERMWNECRAVGLFSRTSYVAELKRHAPVTYKLYEQYCTKKLDELV